MCTAIVVTASSLASQPIAMLWDEWDPFGSATGGGIGSSSSNGDCFIVENFEMWPCEEEEVAYDVLICHTLDIHLDHPAVQQKMIIVILSHRASEEKVFGQ